MCSDCEYWPTRTSVAACRPTMFKTKVYPPHAATMYTYATPASAPIHQLFSFRNARHQTKKVRHMAVTASDSLSYPPATDRMVCAGTMDMTSAAMTAELADPEHSAVRNATSTVATAPNHAGKNTQTSFKDIA